MRTFDHPNLYGFLCPICKTSEDKPVVLIGIEGTEDDGNMQARQYHLACIDLIEARGMSGKYLIQAVPE